MEYYHNYQEIVESMLKENGVENYSIKVVKEGDNILSNRSVSIIVTFDKASKTFEYDAEKYPVALHCGWPYYCPWFDGKGLEKSKLSVEGITMSFYEGNKDYPAVVLFGHIGLLGTLKKYRCRTASSLQSELYGKHVRLKDKDEFVSEITPYLTEVCNLYNANRRRR